jgi:hypothetical protein
LRGLAEAVRKTVEAVRVLLEAMRMIIEAVQVLGFVFSSILPGFGQICCSLCFVLVKFVFMSYIL